MHHKYAVIDSRLLINGSFNWTRQAVLYNQENTVITDNGFLVSVLLLCWLGRHFEVFRVSGALKLSCHVCSPLTPLFACCVVPMHVQVKAFGQRFEMLWSKYK